MLTKLVFSKADFVIAGLCTAILIVSTMAQV